MPLLKLNGQKSIGQSSGHFELLMISKISLIEVQNFIYPWMRFWAGPTSFFWSKGSRGLLEVSFKGVMETSSRREFRIFRLRKGFNWNANWKNLLELFNWRLYKKSGDPGPVQLGPSKSQSELPVFLNSGTWILGSSAPDEALSGYLPGSSQYQVLIMVENTLIEVPKLWNRISEW